MSRGLYRTVVRRDKGMWIAMRMCEQHELYRAHGKTRDEARHNLLMLTIPKIAETHFKQR